MVAYNSALGACGKARSAELALELVKRMDRQQADFGENCLRGDVEGEGFQMESQERFGDI